MGVANVLLTNFQSVLLTPKLAAHCSTEEEGSKVEDLLFYCVYYYLFCFTFQCISGKWCLGLKKDSAITFLDTVLVLLHPNKRDFLSVCFKRFCYMLWFP